jgi:hypothetical protein
MILTSKRSDAMQSLPLVGLMTVFVFVSTDFWLQRSIQYAFLIYLSCLLADLKHSDFAAHFELSASIFVQESLTADSY